MSQNTSKQPITISTKAEGTPDEREQLEPATALRTSTIPVIRDRDSASDTGINFIVTSKADGDELNEKQDSSLTHDEKN